MNTPLPKRGRRASRAGRKFETQIGESLENFGLKKIQMADVRRNEDPAKQFQDFISNCQARRDSCFVPQYQPISAGIYKKKNGVKCDFLLYVPDVFQDGLVLEAKWQDSQGSVDEKMPYLVENIKLNPCDSIVVIGGQGMTPGSKRWIKEQVGEAKNLLEVFESLADFQDWFNSKLA